MAFVKIHKSQMGTSRNTAPNVTMGTYLADGKVHKARSISFRISHPLVEQLGWTKKDGRYGVTIQEGVGSDEGYLALVLDHDTGYVAGAGDSAREHQGISIAATSERFKHYVLNECPVSAYPVNHIVDGDVLIIECPDWLRFNPMSTPEKPKEQVEVKPEVKEQPRPLQRGNAVDDDRDIRLNRRERRVAAAMINKVLRK